ncbi:Ig-like domain repeat protein [Corynebacterium mendelii]|uniref:Ig-like domain repeat protein n=1 Tax=Corynebacterium mendelii TaxID=2765362 RepID=A0A939IVC9_9CORY|nr:Ig-like domain repeat protein [Corynebacterium mendelii]MBN9644106.1 hypothetical protein [Corynebacterium mendelii]
MRARETFALALPVAMAAVMAAPAAAAAESTTVTFNQTCHGVPEKLVPPTDNTGQEVIVRTTSSTSQVAVGETVDVSVVFVPHGAPLQQLPLGAEIVNQYRIKTDLDLPDGFEITGTATSGPTNISGVDVFTVNEAGEKDPEGRILRMASPANATIGNSPNSSLNQPAPGSTPVSGDTITWQMPALNFTMKATTPGTYSLAARNRGGADAPGINPRAYITFLTETQVPVIGPVWAGTYCTPRINSGTPFADSARNLFTWTVIGEEKQPSLEIAPVTATAGETTTVRATVTPPTAEGEITFTYHGQTQSVPVTDGQAEAEMIFDSAGDKKITATFTAADTTASPVTTTSTVTVRGRGSQITLSAPATTRAGDTLTATATIEGAEGVVLFTLGDGKPVSVALAEGKARAEIPVGDDTGELELTAEFTPATQSPLTAAEATTTIKVTPGDNKQTTTTQTTTGDTTSPLVANPDPGAGAPLPAETAARRSHSSLGWLWIVAALLLLIAIIVAVFAVKKNNIPGPDAQ